MRTLITTFALLLLSHSSLADQNTVVWTQDPINIVLSQGEESRINFPEPVSQLDVPDELEKLSKINLSSKGVLLWRIDESISNQRVYATSITGSVYILDVTTSEDIEPLSITIVDPLLQNIEETETIVPEFLTSKNQSPKPLALSYVELARYALTHHIGPQRLIPDDIRATPVDLPELDLTNFVRFNRGLSIRPLRQWKSSFYYVTTIQVINNGTSRYEFDPRALRGDFIFAATLNVVLEPTEADGETVWALVTNKPFELSVGAL